MDAFIDVAARDSRIPNPTVGQMCYIVSTGEWLVYTSTTLGWTKPWNLPWGEVAYAEILSSVAIPFDPFTLLREPVPGLEFMFAPLPGRQYEFVFDGEVGSTVDRDLVQVVARIDGAAIITTNGTWTDFFGVQVFETYAAAATAAVPARRGWRFTCTGPTNGALAHFWIAAAQFSGTGTCRIGADANGISAVRLLDLGPTTNPV